MRVMKFGGTSLSTPDRLETVCTLVGTAAKLEPVAVVASAPAGVTNLLQALVDSPPGSDPSRNPLHRLEESLLRLFETNPARSPDHCPPVRQSLRTSLDYLLAELEGIRARCAREGAWDDALRDRVLGAGERISVQILTHLLLVRGIPARALESRELILTDSTFGGAEIDGPRTADRIRRAWTNLPEGVVPLIPGFTGGDPHGRTTTLGRGTSDLTATLVAAALSVRIVEIWTDVDGIHTKDPSRNPGARVIPYLDYGSARRMARNGARVLHPRTLDPIQPLGIPLQVRNTLRPEAPGTRVGPEPAPPDGCDGARPAQSSRSRKVHLLLAGATGQVAGALLEQIRVHGSVLRERTGFDLRIGAAFNSRNQILSRSGFRAEDLRRELARGREMDWDGAVGEMASLRLERPMFVDLTASRVVADRYTEVLGSSIPLVTANKLGLSGRHEDYLKLQNAAARSGTPFRYETTVGAALPVLGAVRDRHRFGDPVISVEAALSGTLVFVFTRLAEGATFSAAVTEAMALGLTEPDPRQDLSGADVWRKLLILLREAGHPLEPEDIAVESLVPWELEELPDPEEALASIPEYDHRWVERCAEADRLGLRPVYTAAFHEGKGWAGVRNLPPGHPLSLLAPSENLVRLTTGHYSRTPLSISGPGAGPGITASGVLSDILTAAAEMYGSARYPAEGDPPRSGRSARPGRRVA